MLFVAGENLLPILVALLIGFVTGLWVWKFARKVVVKSDRAPAEDTPLRRPYVDNRLPADRDSEPFPTPRPEPEVLARQRGNANEDRAVKTQAVAPQPVIADVAADDLQIMKGVGPRLAALLHEQGISRYDQIAALGSDELARLDAHLGAFKGRLTRDRIVEQAAFLAAGDREGYEKAFGRL